MKFKKLGRRFYARPALTVAKDLLGKFIVRKYQGKEIVGMIVETEAYIGPEDRASHVFGGKITERNKAEFLVGGHIYIYLVYGMYWQLNIVTGQVGQPECVLIRALEPTVKSDVIPNGPGKLCKYLKLDKSFYACDIANNDKIWLEDRVMRVPCAKIVSSPRIGIDYAGEWAKKPWRFYVKDNKFISKI
jgi:DNA-3-methyladenine glycosylase